MDELIAIIAPTPYHLAALNNDIELAKKAFDDQIPFPTLEQYPYNLSPIDLAMLHPCNYRLIALFAIHGHKPMLSESNTKRYQRLAHKQQQLRVYTMLQQLLNNSNTDKEEEEQHQQQEKIQIEKVVPLFTTDEDDMQHEQQQQQQDDITKNIDNSTTTENNNTNEDDQNDNIPDDHEFCTFSSDEEDQYIDDDEENPQEYINTEQFTQEAYDTFLNQLNEKISSVDSQTVELNPNFSLPNRTLLLTATLMNDIGSDDSDYTTKLISQAVVMRCVRLLGQVMAGEIDLNDVAGVKKQINDIYNTQQQLKYQYPFVDWEKSLDILTQLESFTTNANQNQD